MFNFGLGVIARHRVMCNYDIFCNRCSRSIGSMTAEDALRAVFNTLGRGGVLCPSCRIRTCDSCGLEMEPRKLAEVRYAKKPVRLCDTCTFVLDARPEDDWDDDGFAEELAAWGEKMPPPL